MSWAKMSLKILAHTSLFKHECFWITNLGQKPELGAWKEMRKESQIEGEEKSETQLWFFFAKRTTFPLFVKKMYVVYDEQKFEILSEKRSIEEIKGVSNKLNEKK